jgi:colanic acid/amylovoran biosynthesis protein
MDEHESKSIRICLLGASFDTGNLGVNALAESSVKVILARWPKAEIWILGSGREAGEHRLFINGNTVVLKTVPLRLCKNIFVPCHFLHFVFRGLLGRLLPTWRLKNASMRKNPWCEMLWKSDLVVDITGGDSFSDIYGMRRFVLGLSQKWLAILFGKRLVMFPQTYGPFEKRLTQIMARYVLRRSSVIYSRDREGVEFMKNLLNDKAQDGKVRFAPDVAFVLDAYGADQIGILPPGSRPKGLIVGFNISGLIANGGYTRDNMFGLKLDYNSMVERIIRALLAYKDVSVLLIPHVFPPSFLQVESDLAASMVIYNKVQNEYPGRIMVLHGPYTHNEVKDVIRQCEFFIGSRMHSCIAALSQGVPAVGIAYSGKFRGVFDSIGMGEYVMDMRCSKEDEIVAVTLKAFDKRPEIARRIERDISNVQSEVLSILEDID